jgi:release factor glutamine methyltransferase
VRRLRAAGCVFAEDEARLLIEAAAEGADLADLVRRRVEGIPLEHLLGWVGFLGRRVAVDPAVFVPRRRTELLAVAAIALARAVERPVVLELCCGAAAVAAAVAAVVDGAQVHAADLDPAAVRCARRNVAPGRVYRGDLYAALPEPLRNRVDVLVANAPYVPSAAVDLMPPEARLYEPRLALDGGADGLDVVRRVAAGAPDWLAPGGHLLIETSGAQAARTADLMAGAGLTPRILTSAEREATAVVGRLSSRTAAGGS